MLTLALLGGAPLTLPEDVFRLLETALAPPKKARQDDAMPTPAAGPNPLAYYLSQCRAGWQVKLYPGMPVEVPRGYCIGSLRGELGPAIPQVRSKVLSVNQSVIGPQRRHLQLLNTEIASDPVVRYAEIDQASQFARTDGPWAVVSTR